MASPRVMPPSSSAANSDLGRAPSIYPGGDQIRDLGSMSMDELFRNVYSDASPAPVPATAAPYSGGAGPETGEAPPAEMAGSIGGKTVEEVWREISSGGRKVDGGGAVAMSAVGEMMTLEDYLARAGAVREEDVRVPSGAAAGFGLEPVMGDQFGQQQPGQREMPLDNRMLGFGNGVEGGVGGGGRGGRGRKRPVLDPVDKAALQRQKRMIKNRESAARSRERKQAYTMELESLAAQLEEENETLLREQEEQQRERLKHLMENLIPVTEKKKPPRALRRTHSWQW